MKRIVVLIWALLAMSGCGRSAPPLSAADGGNIGSPASAPASPSVDPATRPSPIIVETPTPSIEPVSSPTIIWPTVTPQIFVSGGVEILNECCISAVDGDIITIKLRFTPTISRSVEMRLVAGSGSAIMNQPISDSEPWTPVVAETTYELPARMIADPSYAVCVEFRNPYLDVGPPSCDEIEIAVARTPTPIPSPTPVLPVGSVDIPDYVSVKMDGKHVKDVEIQVDFAASSPFGQITSMRVAAGYYHDYDTLSDAEMAAYPWEPFVPTKIYTTGATQMVNVSWGYCVQYRDDQGNRSRVSCAGTLIEPK